MKLDKAMFLVLALITILVIVTVGFLGRYGSKISDDPTFKLFYNWYIALVLINLLNILSTLIFHYFMIDIPGMRGEKGKVGEKGRQGDDDTCFCEETDTTQNDISLNDTNKIHSHNMGVDYQGSIIHSHTAEETITFTHTHQ